MAAYFSPHGCIFEPHGRIFNPHMHFFIPHDRIFGPHMRPHGQNRMENRMSILNTAADRIRICGRILKH